MRAFAALGLAALACSAAALWACESPVEDDEIASLGDEVEGIPEGPFHRYGQDCLACHAGYGPGEPVFAIGGTVFATPDADIPVDTAIVTIVDATGKSFSAPVNCAGNFYLEADAYDVTFPLHVEIECDLPDGTTRRNVMGTRINRDGGCASCHVKGAPNADSPGQVYCAETQPDPPFEVVAGCEGGPR